MGFYSNTVSLTPSATERSEHSAIIGRRRSSVVSGYRYYSPEIGRWLSRDPIGERGGFNIVSMLLNNMTGLVDAVGRSPIGVLGSGPGWGKRPPPIELPDPNPPPAPKPPPYRDPRPPRVEMPEPIYRERVSCVDVNCLVEEVISRSTGT